MACLFNLFFGVQVLPETSFVLHKECYFKPYSFHFHFLNFNILLISGIVSEEHRNLMGMFCVLASIDVCICVIILLDIIQTSIVFVITI